MQLEINELSLRFFLLEDYYYFGDLIAKQLVYMFNQSNLNNQ